MLNIILPCVSLNVLSLLAFCLPPDAGEKVTLGITVLLSYSVFMLLVAENMPPTSEFVPLIGKPRRPCRPIGTSLLPITLVVGLLFGPRAFSR